MIDIYLVITPIAGFFVLLTVVNIKLALNEPCERNLHKYERKKKDEVKVGGKQNEAYHHQQQIQPPPTGALAQVKDDSMRQSAMKKALLYLLKHWTLLQLFVIRRSRNKIPFILSTCIVAVLSVTINLPFVFCFINTILTLVFLFGKMLSDSEEEQRIVKTIHPENIRTIVNNEKAKRKQERFQQKLQVIFTTLSLIINIIFIGVVYKNYRNQFLISAIENILVTCAVDNFLVKPLVLTITAFFIKNGLFIDQFIDKEIQIVEILHGERVLKKGVDYHISSLSPKKMVSSPSKVPKAVRVEPRINLSNTDQYLSNISLTKSLRKPKLSPISQRKPQNENNNIEGDCSLLSIMNSHEKKLNFSNNQAGTFDFDKSLFQQKVHESGEPEQQVEEVEITKQKATNQQDDKIKQTIPNEQENKSKMRSSKLMMISHDNSIIDHFDVEGQRENQQGEEDDGQNNCANNNKSTIKSMRDSGDYNTILSGSKHDNLKISLHGSIQDHHSDRQNFEEFFEIDRFNQLRPHTTLEEDHSILGYGGVANSGRNGLLKINEDRRAEDLEQIDLNSPERRNQQLKKAIEDSQIPKKKKKNQKKYSLDPNRYVIKHSTGEPYLQFLPNLLNKERQEKKKKSSHQGSQNTFSRKVDLLNGQIHESRVSKSVKRPKNSRDYIMRQNDQNKVPQFTIEEY